MNRTVFLIDGFNLYYSLKAASRDTGGQSTKWLDVQSLCRSYLHLISTDARSLAVYYFTAIVQGSDPTKRQRQKDYLDCLRAIGVMVNLSRFKKKSLVCPVCNAGFTQVEEKETDVAIGVMLLELLFTDICDTVMLVTGDTDIAPAVRTAQRLFPAKTIGFIFPYKRKNNELARLTSLTFDIKQITYQRHQLPDPVVVSAKRMIPKPVNW